MSGPVTLTAADPNGTLTVGNEVVRVTGTFSVTKSVEGGEPGTAFVDGDFTFSYTCSVPLPTAITGTVTVRAGQTTQVDTSIPNGVDLHHRRDRPARAHHSLRLGRRDHHADDVHHLQHHPRGGAAPPTRSASARSRPRCARSSTTPTAGSSATRTSRSACVCGLDGNTTTYGPEPVKADGTVSFPGILVGSTCAPVEAPIDAGDGLRDSSYAWGPPTFSERAGADRPARAATPSPSSTTSIACLRRRWPWRRCSTTPTTWSRPTGTYSGAWTCTHPGDAGRQRHLDRQRPGPGDPDRGSRPGDPARLHLYADRGRPGRAAVGDRPVVLLGRPVARVGHHQRRRRPPR